MTGPFRIRLLVLIFLTLPCALTAITPSDLDWRGLGDDFKQESRQLKGYWKGGDTWKGRLCDGYYTYDVSVGAVLETVDFELNDNGTISVYADLRDLYAGLQGAYRSQASLCIPLRGWSGVGTDRAEIFTEAIFDGENQDLNSLKVRVISTKLGALHLGKMVPAWFERFLGNTLNWALAKIWASKVGEWISDEISDIIKKKIPAEAIAPVRSGYRR